MMIKRATFALVLLIAFGATWSAAACPVCYGDSDSPMVRGAELSILFMAILTYVMIFGGFATFLILRHRNRKARQAGAS